MKNLLVQWGIYIIYRHFVKDFPEKKIRDEERSPKKDMKMKLSIMKENNNGI